MSEFNDISDTIAAVSTAMGAGGIGIVRLSGPEAVGVAERVFAAKDHTRPSQWKSGVVHYGHVVDRRQESRGQGDAVIDEALVTVMRGPKSYTREDVVEISCHGGLAAIRTVLGLVLESGARLAEPGEFTRRAFLNGRIDLVQAEAVLGIIQAATESCLKVSANQLKGELTRELESIREALLKVYAKLEAAINFPEEDIDAGGRQEILALVGESGRRVAALLESGEQGRLLQEGVRLVICGKPNVGKSSLLNVLLKEPRAIVSELPGTTRDTIEETAQIDGIPFRLMDTAGILEPRDVIEREAVQRSRTAIAGADMVLFMLDAGCRFTPEDRALAETVRGQAVLVVVNKCDLPDLAGDDCIRSLFPGDEVVRISALEKTGIDQLRQAVVKKILRGRILDPGRILVSRTRHIEALRRSAALLESACRSLEKGLSFEFVSEDIRQAVESLDAITGRSADRDLLDQIFASFCIGK